MQVYEDSKGQILDDNMGFRIRKINIIGAAQQHVLFKDPFLPKTDPYGEIQYGITENVALTGKDILWITNSTNGILFFDKKEEKFIREFHYDANIKNGIVTDFNNTTYTDPNGILWICTWHGITKVNKQEQQFNSRELPFLKQQTTIG